MILNVVLPGVALANVGYKWLTASGFGAELNAGITDTTEFYAFLIDAVPPVGALELFAYDVNDHSNVSRGNYAQVAIKSKTDNLPASPAATGDAMTLTAGERTSIGTSVWVSATRTLTSFGSVVADVATAVWGAASRTLSAFGFIVDTNANSTETAIKTTTDKLTFTVANQVDANTQSINDVAITGDGQPGTEFGV